jgi:hypothetical protein
MSTQANTRISFDDLVIGTVPPDDEVYRMGNVASLPTESDQPLPEQTSELQPEQPPRERLRRPDPDDPDYGDKYVDWYTQVEEGWANDAFDELRQRRPDLFQGSKQPPAEPSP